MDVQPSVVAADGDRDGIPNVLLEAMASGLPVVSTPVSGIPEVLNDRNSELVAPGDPGAIAATTGQRGVRPVCQRSPAIVSGVGGTYLKCLKI